MTPHDATTRPCLLLVDDTPANIDILVGLLRDDYDLKIATRGAQALRICQTVARVDLVLLDIMMPEMDGFEVCRALRAAPATRDVPIIFLTAKNEAEDIVRGFSIGANDYVAKPFRPPELLARVRTHLTLELQRREIARKNAELTELLHIVSHDVANQFAVASMALELMAAMPGQDPNRHLPRIANAVKNGIALTGLVREMRRLEDKGLAIGPVPLDAALREAVQLVDSTAQAKGVALRLAEPPRADVVAERCSLVNSVLGNLLTNAVKFSRAGDAVEIEARLEGDHAIIAVRDRGVGMPAEILAHLFDVTKSVSRPGTAGERGTGFGMPLLRKFVHHFGGSVEVESRDEQAGLADHGSSFILRLRLAGPAAAPLKTTP